VEESGKIDDQNAVEIRSEEIDEILGRQPGKFIRWGITLIFIVIVVVLAGSYFFKYSDNVQVPIIITSVNNNVNTIVIVKLPAVTTGKVKIGQKVNIKIDNYSSQKYGILTGYIENISLLHSTNNYKVEIALPKGLTTNYNKTLPFSDQLKGVAEIITEDKSLFERFLQP
jgi:hypothetical protein